MRLLPYFSFYHLRDKGACNSKDAGEPAALSVLSFMEPSYLIGLFHREFVFSDMPSIVARLLGGSPSTILGGVWAVVIDAVKNMALRRSPPHISKEWQISRLPTIANSYPSATPFSVLLGINAEAPDAHINPRPILLGVLPIFVAPFAMNFIVSHMGIIPFQFEGAS